MTYITLKRVTCYDIIHESKREFDKGQELGSNLAASVIIPKDSSLTTEEQIELDYQRGLLSNAEYIDLLIVEGFIKLKEV